MKLDPKIKSLSDILTCFNIEEAKQFIGQKGYFADDLCLYNCLAKRQYGVLNRVLDKEYERPFQLKADGLYWDFFIPESRLRSAKENPKKKKWRPYTLEEFMDTFRIGLPIKFRKKDDFGNERYLILNGYVKTQFRNGTGYFVHIGSTIYTLDELFNEYEVQTHYTEDFEPFGVEE